MQKPAKQPVHPSRNLYIIAAILTLLGTVLCFISVFVPFARKDIAPGVRAHAYPFKLCLEDTTSARNAEACLDQDYDEVTSGNLECRGFIVATIVFVFTTVIVAVLFTIPLELLTSTKVWGRPVYLAYLAFTAQTISMIAAFLAWGMWICFAENTCAANSVLYPFRGYSYGWILNVWNSALQLIAWLLVLIALIRLVTYKPFVFAENEVEKNDREKNTSLYPTAANSNMGPPGPYLPPQASPMAGYQPAGLPMPYGY